MLTADADPGRYKGLSWALLRGILVDAVVCEIKASGDLARPIKRNCCTT